jgi:hypothetical protein
MEQILQNLRLLEPAQLKSRMRHTHRVNLLTFNKTDRHLMV